MITYAKISPNIVNPREIAENKQKKKVKEKCKNIKLNIFTSNCTSKRDFL